MRFNPEVDVKAYQKRPGFVIGYKVVKLTGGFEHPYQLMSIVYPYIWTAGINRSNRKRRATRDLEQSRSEIENGIHVYLNERYAKDMAFYRHYRLLPVKCYWRDLVAVSNWFEQGAGTDTAVFTKVTLPQEDYENALKPKP